MNRRQFNAATALGLLGTWMNSPALAQGGFPDRPITVVVPYAAGGVVDVYARVVAEEMSQSLPQRVIVDNRAGADGRIGMEKVQKAPADGYTLLAASPILAVGEFLGTDFSFKARDFTGIGAIASPPATFVVPSSMPVRTIKELVALAKSKPGELNVPHPGRGSSIQLAQELFFQVAGITVNSVPYKGQSPALIDLAAGNLSFALLHQSVALPLIQSGRLRALATNAAQRTRSLPDVPTVAEVGYPDTLVRSWAGLVAPAATPATVVDFLSTAMRRAMASSSVRDRLKEMDVEILDMDGSQFTAMIQKEVERFGKLIRERNIRA